MAESTVLDRLVLEGLEVGAEVTILKVDNSLTNKIITEEQIVVPELHLQERATGEDSLELEHLVDFWTSFVLLIIVTIGE